MKKVCGLLALASILCFGVAAARAASPEDLLDAVRERYSEVEDIQAHFVQNSVLVASGLESVVEGEVVFGRGGRMRWTYQGDDPQVIVCDGRTLWFYQVRDRTVLHRDLNTLPPSSRLALDLLSGFEGIEEHFSLGACGDGCLELVPIREQSDLSLVRVELDPEEGQVRRVTTEDPLGNRTRVELSAVRVNAGVTGDPFRLDIPEGVQVLDMENSGP